MLLLGIDVETTGINQETDRVIEIGAVLWDTELGQPVKLLSELVLETPDMTLPTLIEELTGISTPMLHRFGKAPSDLLFAQLDEMIAESDACVAHNASFDKGFMTKFYERNGKQFPAKTWICTLNDVDYPASIRSRSLIYLAATHGFVNPFSHRALTDVLSMFKVLSFYDIPATLENSQSPRLELVANVSYDNRGLAKDMGFRWDGAAKKWKKQIRTNQYDPKKLPFEVEVIEL